MSCDWGSVTERVRHSEHFKIRSLPGYKLRDSFLKTMHPGKVIRSLRTYSPFCNRTAEDVRRKINESVQRAATKALSISRSDHWRNIIL